MSDEHFFSPKFKIFYGTKISSYAVSLKARLLGQWVICTFSLYTIEIVIELDPNMYSNI